MWTRIVKANVACLQRGHFVFDSITKLRSLCSQVKVKVDHEFAEAMFRYLQQHYPIRPQRPCLHLKCVLSALRGLALFSNIWSWKSSRVDLRFKHFLYVLEIQQDAL